jgi:hypothetical protein
MDNECSMIVKLHLQTAGVHILLKVDVGEAANKGVGLFTGWCENRWRTGHEQSNVGASHIANGGTRAGHETGHIAIGLMPGVIAAARLQTAGLQLSTKLYTVSS